VANHSVKMRFHMMDACCAVSAMLNFSVGKTAHVEAGIVRTVKPFKMPFSGGKYPIRYEWDVSVQLNIAACNGTVSSTLAAFRILSIDPSTLHFSQNAGTETKF